MFVCVETNPLALSQDGRAEAGSAEAMEEFRSRVFSLEEENASLKRVAELELPREVEALKHQVGGQEVCREFFCFYIYNCDTYIHITMRQL